MNNVFTTRKGTQLPLLNLKGKAYLQVAHRLVYFREEHPQGRIVCNVVSLTDTAAVAKAEIYFVGSKPDGNTFEILVASAHKKETEENFGDFIEKAETGAVGRALAMAGFGTQFEPELDEGDRLADSPVATPSRNTVPRPEAKPQPANILHSGGTAPVAPLQPEVPKSTSREAINKKINLTSKVIIESKRASKEEVGGILSLYGVSTKEELNDEQAKDLLVKLEGVLNAK